MQVIMGPRNVVVGFDGSLNSTVALRRAGAEARERHARLEVVRVIPREDGLWRTLTAWLRLRGEVQRLVPRAQRVTTRLRIARGDTGTQLSRLAERADLLVVGAGRESRNGAPLAGATVSAVLCSPPCRVIVCEDDTDAEV
ncbi:universal stress protein [Actinoallomurus acaciae]|uniref:Universal stress protein n=1 Tax=Actinoallomurus acaciae TaxID=502577 RepID=A0ABV5Y948_9ACTN